MCIRDRLAIGISAWHYLRNSQSEVSLLNEHIINWLAFLLTIIASCGLASIHFTTVELPYTAGGRVGEVVARNFLTIFGIIGSTLLLTGLTVAGITLMISFSWLNMMDNIGRFLFLAIGKIHIGITTLIDKRAMRTAADKRETDVLQRKQKLRRIDRRNFCLR